MKLTQAPALQSHLQRKRHGDSELRNGQESKMRYFFIVTSLLAFVPQPHAQSGHGQQPAAVAFGRLYPEAPKSLVEPAQNTRRRTCEVNPNMFWCPDNADSNGVCCNRTSERCTWERNGTATCIPTSCGGDPLTRSTPAQCRLGGMRYNPATCECY